MVMRKVVLMLMLALCLAGCKERPVSGYVVGKAHFPAHTQSHYDVIFKRPTLKYIPEQWVVWVADSCRVQSVQVDKCAFDTLKRGQFVTSKGRYYGKTCE